MLNVKALEELVGKFLLNQENGELTNLVQTNMLPELELTALKRVFGQFNSPNRLSSNGEISLILRFGKDGIWC